MMLKFDQGAQKAGASLKQDGSQVLMILLSAVVMSSLALLVFGLNPKRGAIEIMQLPTTLAQMVFIYAVALQVGVRRVFAPMTIK